MVEYWKINSEWDVTLWDTEKIWRERGYLVVLHQQLETKKYATHRQKFNEISRSVQFHPTHSGFCTEEICTSCEFSGLNFPLNTTRDKLSLPFEMGKALLNVSTIVKIHPFLQIQTHNDSLGYDTPFFPLQIEPLFFSTLINPIICNNWKTFEGHYWRQNNRPWLKSTRRSPRIYVLLRNWTFPIISSLIFYLGSSYLFFLAISFIKVSFVTLKDLRWKAYARKR